MDVDDEDLTLLQAWREGDRAAGDRLFKSHFVSVYRFFVNKTRSLTDTEELTQSTFEALVIARDRFGGKSSFRTYVLGIANNLLRRYYRDLARADNVDPLVSSVAELGAGAQTHLECAEAHRLLLHALRQIPAEFQIVLELYYIEAMRPDAIAEALDVNANTVRSRLQRAKEHLRHKIRELAAAGAGDDSAPTGDDGWGELLRDAFPTSVLLGAFTYDES